MGLRCILMIKSSPRLGCFSKSSAHRRFLTYSVYQLRENKNNNEVTNCNETKKMSHSPLAIRAKENPTR